MSVKSKRFLGILGVVALLLQGTAFAQATFTSTSGKITTISSYAGSLFVKWSEAGLSSGGTTSYTITGSSTAEYACTTGGSPMCPASASSADLLWFATNASANGTIRQSVAVPPASAGSCTCPSGSLVLYQVSYGNSANAPDLQICDDSNPGAACASIGPGYFSQTFCKQNSLRNCPPAS